MWMLPLYLHIIQKSDYDMIFNHIYRQELLHGDKTLLCYFLVYINVQKYVFDNFLILEANFH